MPADIHLIKAEGAYERVPAKGQNGLQFPVERYLPPKDFINFDDELKYRTKLLHMARNSNRTTLCLRCGIPTGQHPKDICFCQWCGCRADDIHPDLVSASTRTWSLCFQEALKLVPTLLQECPWIYASVSFWKSKLVITDPASGERSSDWVPVNVQIQPTKEEQAFLALENPIFLDFPRAREGRNLVVPDGANMMHPVLMPRKLKIQELNRGEKRQHEDGDEASERPNRRLFVVGSDKHVELKDELFRELKDTLFRELKDKLFHELSRMREKIARLSYEVTELRALTEMNRENQFPSRPPIRQYGGFSPSRSEYREDTSPYSSNPRRQGDRSSQLGNHVIIIMYSHRSSDRQRHTPSRHESPPNRPSQSYRSTWSHESHENPQYWDVPSGNYSPWRYAQHGTQLTISVIIITTSEAGFPARLFHMIDMRSILREHVHLIEAIILSRKDPRDPSYYEEDFYARGRDRYAREHDHSPRRILPSRYKSGHTRTHEDSSFSREVGPLQHRPETLPSTQAVDDYLSRQLESRLRSIFEEIVAKRAARIATEASETRSSSPQSQTPVAATISEKGHDEQAATTPHVVPRSKTPAEIYEHMQE
ncbi:hypothetical protein COCCADRAFT_5896 [Bipolaris zeicola 26-R-13]|uniref:Uncharacterized protein n=1 Tax=Cochliobolus carbonum (strain 26-R-13) TaxID=930089 RepID=W6Y340_COCC2|nr:uncharacterized protein COCCADRAFT_5896 [Bipolaris zeicola 26-R-13]EUC32358.1 hypothetical protein COCCADRAFT_5896 [Bipolaris zeicola 26-R-13]